MRLLLSLILFAGSVSADNSAGDTRPGLLSPRSLTLYYNSQGPLNFNTLTFKSLPPGAKPIGEVKAKSCQYGISIPLGIPYSSRSSSQSLSGIKGNSSYKKLMANLQKEHPGLDGIYDVKMDKHIVRVLMLFTRLCIEISAQGFEE